MDAGRKIGFTQQWTKFEPGIVVSHFAKAGEGIFGGLPPQCAARPQRTASAIAAPIDTPSAYKCRTLSPAYSASTIARVSLRSSHPYVAIAPPLCPCARESIITTLYPWRSRNSACPRFPVRLSETPWYSSTQSPFASRRKNLPALQHRAVRSAHLEILFRRIRCAQASGPSGRADRDSNLPDAEPPRPAEYRCRPQPAAKSQ